MKIIVSIFTFMLILVGCSSTSNPLHVEQEKVLNFSMANSKKVEIAQAGTSRTYITITYLNPIAHELVTQDSEKFVVGTYLATGESAMGKITLKNFKLNGKDEGVKVSALAKGAEILKIIPSTNQWADYVLVEAPFIEDLNMTFSFESDHSKPVSLVFRKDY